MMKQKRASATSVANFDSCLTNLWKKPSPHLLAANAICAAENAKPPQKPGRSKRDESYNQRLYPNVSDHTSSLTQPTDDESKSLSDSSSSFGMGNNRNRQVAASAFHPVAVSHVPPAAASLREKHLTAAAASGTIEETEHSCDTTVMRGGNADSQKRDGKAQPLISDRFAPIPSAGSHKPKVSKQDQAPAMEDTSICILDDGDSSGRRTGKHQGSNSRGYQEYSRKNHHREDAPPRPPRSEDGSTSLRIEGSHHSGRRSNKGYPSSQDGSISLLDIDGVSGHYSGRGGFTRSEEGSVSLLSEFGPSRHSDRRPRDYHHRGHASFDGRSRGNARDCSYHRPYDPHRCHQDAYHHDMAHSESHLNYDHGRRQRRHPGPSHSQWKGHYSISHFDREHDRYDYSGRGANERDEYYYDRDPYYYEEGPGRVSRRERYDAQVRHNGMVDRRRALDSYDERYSPRREPEMYPRDRGQTRAPGSYQGSQHWREREEREMRRGGSSNNATLRRAGTCPLPRSEESHHSSRPRRHRSQVEGTRHCRDESHHSSRPRRHRSQVEGIRHSGDRLEKDTSVEQRTPGAFAARSLVPAAARNTGSRDKDVPSAQKSKEEEDVYLEVAPGVEEKLRGTEETKKAIESDFYDSSACWGCCTSPLFCIADVAFFVCPTCKCVSPLENTNRHIRQHGVGLAFTRDTLVQLQEEIADESRPR